MKKSVLLMVLVVMALLLTGCAMEVKTGLVIDNANNVKMEGVIAYDNEFIDMMLDMQQSTQSTEGAEVENPPHTDNERWAYIESSISDDESYQDYKKERYQSGEMKGMKISKDIGKLEDLIKEDEEAVEYDEIQSGEEKVFTKKGNVYSLKIDLADSENVSQSKERSSEGLNTIMEFYVTLPKKAKSHNATSVSNDQRTYTWDLLNASSIEISFEEGSGGAGILLWIILFAIVGFVIYKKSQKTNIANDAPEEFQDNVQ